MRHRFREARGNGAAWVLIFIFVFVVGGVSDVAGRDFMERPAAIAPGGTPDGFGLLPALYGEVAYHSHLFSDSDTDTFQIRNFAHVGLVDVGTTRIGFYYGTFLLS
ncbi:MAG: hypothetical protein PF508_11765, partial [Spirochaeta sp.]|nr:hypothetical protein [Spirochaeta sp.]